MPVVTIHMEKGRSIEMKGALADGVSKAVTAALDVPPEWVTIIIDEIERENWAVAVNCNWTNSALATAGPESRTDRGTYSVQSR